MRNLLAGVTASYRASGHVWAFFIRKPSITYTRLLKKFTTEFVNQRVDRGKRICKKKLHGVAQREEE
jgi:hypothetical protein